MSRDWTKEELQAASKAMAAAGNMSYEEFCEKLNEMTAKMLIERFAKKQRDGDYPCPCCGFENMNSDPIRNALSRRANVMICDECGTVEALEDYFGKEQSLTDWAVVMNPESFDMA